MVGEEGRGQGGGEKGKGERETELMSMEHLYLKLSHLYSDTISSLTCLFFKVGLELTGSTPSGGITYHPCPGLA